MPESYLGNEKQTPFKIRLRHEEVFVSPCGSFYSSKAKEIWYDIKTLKAPMVHDAYVKICQLKGLSLPEYTTILVDECQDLNECQIDLFINQQISNGINVIVCGQVSKTFKMTLHVLSLTNTNRDQVQAIYSFRGAQSRLMSSLPNAVDFKLTKSFRFGPNIANVANRLIWIKENSPQVLFTLENSFLIRCLIRQAKWFNTYRVEGVSDEVGVVFHAGFPPFPFTFIARHNATLIMQGIVFAEMFPDARIFIKGNTDGISADKGKFVGFANDCEDIYRLKMGTRPRGKKYKKYSSYEDLKEHAKLMDMENCLSLIGLVENYGTDLPEKIQLFKEMLTKHHSESEADIILTTAHQCKGLQWDYVMVCENPCKNRAN